MRYFAFPIFDGIIMDGHPLKIHYNNSKDGQKIHSPDINRVF